MQIIPLMVGKKSRGIKSLLMRMEEQSEKSGLKLNIQKMKIVASCPITSWQIQEEQVEAVKDFIFFSSKITGNSDYSHEIKICLLFGRKAMTNLDSVLESRDITLLTKVRIIKAMVLPVVMYRCTSWMLKFSTEELMLLKSGAGGLLRVPWTARRSNQSILKETNPDYSLKD